MKQLPPHDTGTTSVVPSSAAPQGGLIDGHRVRPRRHPLRWSVAAAIVLLLVLIALAFANGNIRWEVVAENLTAPSIIVGVGLTLLMTVCAMALGLALGTLIAVMRMSQNPIARAFASGYLWVFRGVPALLQLMIWYNISLVFPIIGIPGLFALPTNEVMTPFIAALLGLGLSQSAYSSEVIRAGVLSVDVGQTEAALAIGMTRSKLLRRIVLPQALRVIVPPVGNEVIGMLKYTSLAAIISYNELLRQAQFIYYVNNRVIELLFVATVWYLVCVSVLSLVQAQLEHRLGRGFVRSAAKRTRRRKETS